AINNTAQQVSGAIGTAVLVTIMNSVTKTEAESLMTGVDPATLTESAMGALTQQALLSGIQVSFYVALGMNLLALVLAFFVKRVDVRKLDFKEEESELKKAN
ncbi:MAG: multidrug efflux MFS transporter, partial [Exiguobacterium chiriqhucha]